MIQLSGLRHRLTRRKLHPPLGFVHIPKAAGTSVVQQLESRLRPRKFVYGLDLSQFGSFSAFDTMPVAMRATIFDHARPIPEEVDIIAGHLSPKTILAQYPTAKLVTFMRAPAPRLLSHWFYWRGYTDDILAKYGAWGDAIASARSDLNDFLCTRQIACVIDNVTLRMLLWPHPLIPEDDFIDPKHDSDLLAEALRTLEQFSYVNIIEAPDTELSLNAWLKENYGRSFWASVQSALRQDESIRKNPSKVPAVKMNVPLSIQLQNIENNAMNERIRLDDQLWHKIAARHFTQEEANRIYTESLSEAVKRYEYLNEHRQINIF